MVVWLKQLVAGPGGGPDEASVAFLLGAVIGLGLEVFSIVHGAPFNLMEYSASLAALLGVYNSSIGWRAKLSGGGDNGGNAQTPPQKKETL